MLARASLRRGGRRLPPLRTAAPAASRGLPHPLRDHARRESIGLAAKWRAGRRDLRVGRRALALEHRKRLVAITRKDRLLLSLGAAANLLRLPRTLVPSFRKLRLDVGGQGRRLSSQRFRARAISGRA